MAIEVTVRDTEAGRVTHAFEITRDERRKRGWHLAYRCVRRDCDSHGDLTVPGRDAALRLFGLLSDGHARLDGDDDL